MIFLITGGSGFIGSALVRHLISHSDHEIHNVDILTYAATESSLSSVEDSDRYNFHQVDITKQIDMRKVINSIQPDVVMHLAAESHVDRSISGPLGFVHTNILGTAVLLEECKVYWQTLDKKKKSGFRFHHISTDEVFGSLGKTGTFDENSPYDPSSPYSASKAASDHLVRAWHRTYSFPSIVTNCSNNYGPHQYPEKLIPMTIINCLNEKPIPVYGDGKQIRDWLHVEDHVEALIKVIESGLIGSTYNIGGGFEITNIDLVSMICDLVDERKGNPSEDYTCRSLIKFVPDRPGHDVRYAIDSRKIFHDLGWRAKRSFLEGLATTVDWYMTEFEG